MSMEVPWFHGSIGSPWNRSLKWNGNLPLNLNGISMDCRCPTLSQTFFLRLTELQRGQAVLEALLSVLAGSSSHRCALHR
jgi:hypothetical protein